MKRPPAQADMFTKSTGLASPASPPEPRPLSSPSAAPEVERAAPTSPPDNVAVYEMTGPFSTVMWLCPADLALMTAPPLSWSAKKVVGANVLVPPFCDCCLRRAREMARAS